MRHEPSRAAGRDATVPRIRKRIASVDVLRGAIMVLMALDHVRDYTSRLHFPPEDLSRATVGLFATRWVTHFCAPGFSLLAGMGIGLAMQRGNSAGAMSRFLLVRGVWLVVLDLVVTPIGWRLGFDLIPAFALVLWALGLSMIVMAALVHLPRAVVAAGALLMIALHNLLDGIQPADLGAWAPLWNVLHVPGFVIPGKLFVGYPLVPWVAVMALGWALAAVYEWEEPRRRRFLVVAGVAATALFVVVRAWNGYGDPLPWSPQRTTGLTVASFLDARKYPPSLDFLLMTLGPLLVALALLERARGRVADRLAVYGAVPLFFYVIHIFLAHLVAIGIAWVQGGAPRRILAASAPETIPDWYGLPLPGVYVAWAVVVLAMYPLCRWFARLKRERDDWWLSYL
ncbi:MAG TPA: heparan-alpha-glucosaminide N-acetyltransferase domain-containing protein [Thermoanaerobaculia bacterium]|nr:heparan-alpha-glucosaminide N-acetyltransferase domain-containing protein [Thermoanaerobaculia bacterium]